MFGGCAATPPSLRAMDSHGAPVVLHQEKRGSTTVIDLENLAGTGELILTPSSPNAWPKRLTLRISRSAVRGLLVRTEAGLLVTPVADTEPAPKEVTLQPSLYAHTSQITVRWQQ